MTTVSGRPLVSLPLDEGYDEDGKYYASQAAVAIPTAEEFDLLVEVVEVLLALVNPNDLDAATPEAKAVITRLAEYRRG